MSEKELIIFDLDGTLAPSKSSIDPEMAGLLETLLKKKKILVMSGGRWKQFEKQFLNFLKLGKEDLANLFISPGSGSSLYRFVNGEVHEMYADHLTKEEKARIRQAFEYALPLANYAEPKTFGEVIEDRGTQMTFSGLGQEAPLDLKEKWDPDHKRRIKIMGYLIEKIPDLEIHIGGATSIDVNKKGEGKDFGIRQIGERLGIPIEKMVYIGDALFQGGNDEPAKKTGVETVQVSGPNETKEVIREIIRK